VVTKHIHERPEDTHLSIRNKKFSWEHEVTLQGNTWVKEKKRKKEKNTIEGTQ
jgi:hypothetical protein